MTERVITVGIGQVILASATSGFSSYLYKAAPLLRSSSSSGVRASDQQSEGPGFNQYPASLDIPRSPAQTLSRSCGEKSGLRDKVWAGGLGTRLA